MIGTNEALPAKSHPELLTCQLIDKKWLTATIIRLRIAHPGMARTTHPGQFVNIKVSSQFIPLLRRPFSIHRVNRRDGWIEILFQTIGAGTKLLADFEIGQQVDLGGQDVVGSGQDRAARIGPGRVGDCP